MMRELKTEPNCNYLRMDETAYLKLLTLNLETGRCYEKRYVAALETDNNVEISGNREDIRMPKIFYHIISSIEQNSSSNTRCQI